MTGAATGIEGHVAIVTGTSSGLGQRFAQVLDEAGARLVLASRRHGEDLGLAAQLRDAWPVGCDVRVAADREALVSAAVEHFGQVNILVNNAGVAYSGRPRTRAPSTGRTSSTPTSPGCSPSPSWRAGTCSAGAAA